MINSLSDAVYIGYGEEKCGIGSSKFWGAPDIPEDFDWPVDADGYDMDFICQIRTRDIDPDNKVFAKSGILYFFGCIASALGYEDAPPITPGYQPDGYFAVRFSAAAEEELQYGEIVDDDGEPVGFGELKMEFSNDENAFSSALHQALGEPPEQAEEADGEALLLCVDSFAGRDFTLEFEDSGYLYFLIKADELGRGDFGSVRAYLSV